MAADVTRAIIVVPRRPEPWRDKLWAHLRPIWRTRGWPIVESLHEGGLFNRSAAINDGAFSSGNWDVMVILDADAYVAHEQVDHAIRLAHGTDSIAFAFDLRYALTKRSTEAVLSGEKSVHDFKSLPLERAPHRSDSQVVAMPRGLWEQMGHMDERFEGWGFEDTAVMVMQRTLRGEPHRIEGPVVHLWHQRAPERAWGNPNYGVNRAISRRYLAAEGDEDALRAIIAERASGTVPGLDRAAVHAQAVRERTQR